ncbi:MAG: type pilus assembly protein PilB [Gaiellaceae bacterium]|nr:type pilus assembly protein PilB [Gaiellaceae bacterium]
MLVRDGIITVPELEAALEEKDRTGVRVGDILIAHGWATKTDVTRSLAEQYSLDFVDIEHEELSPDVRDLLTERVMRQCRALPIRYLAKNLALVAVTDPTDIAALDNVKLALGVNLKFCIADPQALETAIDKLFRRPVLRAIEPDAIADAEQDEREELDLDDPAPAVSLVNQILAQAIHDRASDVHFEPHDRELVVRARIDGVTRELVNVPKTMQAAVLSRLKVMAKLDIADKRIAQDGRVAVRLGGEAIDLRVAVLPVAHGEKVVCRILRRASVRVSLPDLGMTEAAAKAFRRAVEQPFGCVLTCGPTGAGKTTTLYAALDHLNDPGRVLVTIEDPVEYELAGASQVQVNPRAGLTFSTGLRTILRSDPDVLLVGEIRDLETAEIAMQAAMTGHLVLSTVHAHSAASALSRLENIGVEPHVLASSINCIVGQRLVRVLCSRCRTQAPATPEELAELGLAAEQNVVLARPEGCTHCSGTGYHGRMAIYEVLPLTPAIRKLVGESAEVVHEAAVAEGMVTLRQDGLRLAFAGVTSLDEVRRVAGD